MSEHVGTPPGGSPLSLIPAWTERPLQRRGFNPSLGLELADASDCNGFLRWKQALYAIGMPGRKGREGKKLDGMDGLKTEGVLILFSSLFHFCAAIHVCVGSLSFLAVLASCPLSPPTHPRPLILMLSCWFLTHGLALGLKGKGGLRTHPAARPAFFVSVSPSFSAPWVWNLDWVKVPRACAF